MKLLSLSILTLSVLAAAPAGAQTLSLFEAAQSQEQSSQAPALIGGPGLLEPGPGFSLRSVARFGDSYWGLVTDAVGNSMEVHWLPGEQTSLGELAQYSGYKVLELTARTLRLQFPQGLPCSASGQEGLVCVDDTTALLSLVSLAPLQSNGSLQAVLAAGPFGPGKQGRQDLLQQTAVTAVAAGQVVRQGQPGIGSAG